MTLITILTKFQLHKILNIFYSRSLASALTYHDSGTHAITLNKELEAFSPPASDVRTMLPKHIHFTAATSISVKLSSRISRLTATSSFCN